MELVSGVGNTTRAQLREMMRTFYEAPDVAKNDFVTALEPLFGRSRAEMIAVTEMTNAYSAATIETAKQAPIPVMYEVSTVNDPLVCSICTEAEAGGPYPLDDTEHRPALHPRCRCDAVIVERPAEERVPSAAERIEFHGSKEDKAFWLGEASKLPEEHIQTLRGVYAMDDKAWLSGKQIPMTAYQGKDAAGMRLNSRIICYRGKWARDAHVVLHEMAHEAWTNVPGEALTKINVYWKRAASWNEANPGAWLAQKPSRFISRYSLVNGKEFFAEHYSAYVLQPRELQKMSKGLYNMYRDQIFNGLEFL